MKLDRQAAFTGTKDVAEALRFPVAPLEAYLTEKVAAFAGPLTVRQFKGGQSNPTYLLETPQRRFVLRRKPPGKLLPSAHAVDREFRAITALHPQGFPVAEPVIYCDDPGLIGTAFYVMGFADGRVFWEPDMPASNPAERTAVYDAMNATLARLHSFDPKAIGLGDFGRGENYVARQVDRWSKQYRASETEKVDEMERLMDWLPQNLPPAGPVRVVHGDYRLDNMILAADAPRILAVLDWELSTLGHPLADLGQFLAVQDLPPDYLLPGLAGVDRAVLGLPTQAELRERYLRAMGWSPATDMRFFKAFAMFRQAAMSAGLRRRAALGTAVAESALFFGNTMDVFARVGLDILDRAD